MVGGSGFLGQRLLKVLGSGAIGTYSTNPFAGGIRLDTTRSRLADVEAHLSTDLRHVFILHGAVNPDWCARDPQATRRINVDSIINLLKDCFERGLTPVFMSTDYVYDGRGG